MNYDFATRMSVVKPSIIRQLNTMIKENPGTLTFGGGNPAPELFPIKELSRIGFEVLNQDGRDALQYDTTDGIPPLRRWIANRMNSRQQTNYGMNNVLISSGAQQAIDLVARVFLNEGDCVFVEDPTYVTALNAFRTYGAEIIGVETDEDGMCVNALEMSYEKHPNVKLMYIIPDFQNPSTKSWSTERRRLITQFACEHQIIIIEDNPYHELRYEGSAQPSLKAFDTQGVVLNLGSFSKILCPGLRIGWVAGDEKIIQKINISKQSSDLQSNSLTQRMVWRYLETQDIDEHIHEICELYKRRRDVMIEAINCFFPSTISYEVPKGGLFLWMNLNRNINTQQLFQKSLENGVAFVPGYAFYVDGRDNGTIRLNFSSMPESRILDGIERLGTVLKH